MKYLAAFAFGALCLATASASYPNPITDDELVSVITKSIDPFFYQVASEVGTDKVWDHRYDFIYSRLLSHIRKEPIRLLEIGLGCNMGYGAGKSLAMWKKYIPNAKVSYLEYDAPCATKHKTEIEAAAGGTLYIGDQADQKLLDKILADSKAFGGYDVIIDDGGHTVNQMLTSIKTLWHALKAGGAYVVEDISENYIEKPFRDENTFIGFAKNAIDIVQCRMKPAYLEGDSVVQNEFKEFCAQTAMDIISIECAPEACTMFKGKPRVRGLPAGSKAKTTQVFGEYPPLRTSSSGGSGSVSKHARQHRSGSGLGRKAS
jgi:cephalosporin hydroxylase